MAAAFKFMEICLGNLNKLFSDGSYIAEPARCQSRERLVKIAVLLLLGKDLGLFFPYFLFRLLGTPV